MNSITKRNQKKDSAVSPVVGVMLMLVVTIIIAAIVSAFAGGLVTSADKAPNAVLKVDIVSKLGGGD
ncbi:MAG TPA: type IV pilin [Methanocorpusculum sp.]|nr:type IV pilin [Methanocorpusculum sp.]